MPERKIYDNITFFSVYKWLASMVQMRGSRNFHQGGGGSRSVWQKSPDNDFFSPQLILQKSNGQFQRNLSFFKAPDGVQFFSRGSNFFQGVSNCLFPIETHLICDFTEGVRTPCPPPPSGSPLGAALTASWLRLLYIISFGLGKR